MARSDPTRDPRGLAALRVLGAPPRSLFDAVRPGLVQQEGETIRGPGGMALAALQHRGVTKVPDRPADAVVLAGRTFGGLRDGWLAVEEEGRAMGVAYGLAVTRSRRAAPGRTWCLLRASALGQGGSIEVVNLLADLPSVGLVVVVVGPGDRTRRASALLLACGVGVWQADNADAWSVLSAMDHACRGAETAATAVVATRDLEG
ncbi:MAG TPA: hypothetical protein VMM13_00520 [Euzebya sp.]|nr:hypothetical protein [Euzebya sp.]